MTVDDGKRIASRASSFFARGAAVFLAMDPTTEYEVFVTMIVEVLRI
jgi:hypothetical protein